ncbi:MAG TPA: prepilin-type N-terminal cleavage/methylation domain-containing protein [Candidatus Paceibacterota bacterium]|nr:prepilin-type N-terminal cleavage/methylation domain-containing protein [Candidatus Paceibacterota bacterium]
MKGFTLIETLVAVLLLSIAIAGPLTIAARGANAAQIAKDQIIAYYLAQDAVEFVRFERDSSCLPSTPCASTGTPPAWLAGVSGAPLTPCVSTDGSAACYIDSRTNQTGSCLGTPASCSSPIKYDGASGRGYYVSVPLKSPYTSCSGTSCITTTFLRSVKIVYSASTPTEALLTVTVSWTDAGSLSHSVVLTEDMFDWE